VTTILDQDRIKSIFYSKRSGEKTDLRHHNWFTSVTNSLQTWMPN